MIDRKTQALTNILKKNKDEVKKQFKIIETSKKDIDRLAKVLEKYEKRLKKIDENNRDISDIIKINNKAMGNK